MAARKLPKESSPGGSDLPNGASRSLGTGKPLEAAASRAGKDSPKAARILMAQGGEAAEEEARTASQKNSPKGGPGASKARRVRPKASERGSAAKPASPGASESRAEASSFSVKSFLGARPFSVTSENDTRDPRSI